MQLHFTKNDTIYGYAYSMSRSHNYLREIMVLSKSEPRKFKGTVSIKGLASLWTNEQKIEHN
jgi:predicted transcriptional regulator with HTH domain